MESVTYASSTQRWKAIIIPIALFLWAWTAISGCNYFHSPQSAAERAGEYWAYKVKGEYEKAYTYEAPEFREKVKMADYLTSGTKWLEARVGEAQVSNDHATVEVTLRYVLLRPWFPEEGIEKTIMDRWVLLDEVWYHDFGKAGPVKQNEKK